jgi:hypothetical protein
MMNPKRFSTVCCTAVMLIGAIGLGTVPAQAATQREKFFLNFVRILRQEPHLPGDEAALTGFSLLSDTDKEDLFIAGKTVCEVLNTGVTTNQFLNYAHAQLKQKNYSKQERDIHWSLRVATVNSAKASICP